jgi:hypothetical protein
MERNVTEADIWFVPRKVYFPFSECRNWVCVHAGPKLSVTNSKKRKNARLSRGIILCHLDAGKNANLEKSSLQESPFTEMTYHVWGCMTFRSNELGLTSIMAQFIGMRPYRTSTWALGCQGMPRRPIFVSSHEKCFFYFRSAEIRFFVKRLPKL